MQPEQDPQGGSELSVPAGVQAEAKQRIRRECCKRDSNTRNAELTPLPLQTNNSIQSQVNCSQIPQSAELPWVSYSIARYSVLNY